MACEIAGSSSTALTQDQMMLQIHVYQPSESDSFEEFTNSIGSKSDEDNSSAAIISELPNRDWNGLWDSLIYDNDIKMKLLDYIHATLVFSDAGVDCKSEYSFSFHHIPNSTWPPSQPDLMESGSFTSWTARYRENVSMSCSCS